MFAEELKSYVMILNICINAAFLYIPLQHMYASKYRKNWLLKKKQKKISAEVTHQAISQC